MQAQNDTDYCEVCGIRPAVEDGYCERCRRIATPQRNGPWILMAYLVVGIFGILFWVLVAALLGAW
jgi:hypothetical protein